LFSFCLALLREQQGLPPELTAEEKKDKKKKKSIILMIVVTRSLVNDLYRNEKKEENITR
jgi:hypothetical protein